MDPLQAVAVTLALLGAQTATRSLCEPLLSPIPMPMPMSIPMPIPPYPNWVFYDTQTCYR